MNTPIKSAKYTTIQDLIFPDRRICTERDLYMRLFGPAGLSDGDEAIVFESNGSAVFNTAFNLFNSGKWVTNCGLTDLHLLLHGQGKFEVSVFLALEARSWERLVCEVVTLSANKPTRLDLSHFADFDDSGLIYFEVKALTAGILENACWQTTQEPRRIPELVLSITTFKREAAVQRSVRRFEDFVTGSDLKDHIRLVVVDNGKTANIAASTHVTPIGNENLGGAGGFARGLIEARRMGASHCLFMDDDASVHMQSFERTWMMLAYAIDSATAVAGGITIAAHRWALWENGAVFASNCKPQYLGLDLRDQEQVFRMEFETNSPKPDNFYGGWWYFAFPIEHVKHMPFPFFVRGDDVSFGLAHDFNILTLPGVVSFQDADFSDKESAQTLYLDLRSHLVHHLCLPHMEIGPWQTYKIALWFFLRNFLSMHYETLSALNLAVEDVLRGPEFFAENADMAQRRADIKALTNVEVWQPIDPARKPDRHRFNPHRRLTRLFLKLSLNGHLLPFFRLYGNRITLEAHDRGNVRAVWGAAQITYLDAKKKNSYTVVNSKRLALRESWRLMRNGWRFLTNYTTLRDTWREGYVKLASDDFWVKTLRITDVPKPIAADKNGDAR